MRQILKWSGFALVAFGIAVFPFAIWFPGPWGVISLVMVIAGCLLLVLVLPASSLFPIPDEPINEPDDVSDQDKPVQ